MIPILFLFASGMLAGLASALHDLGRFRAEEEWRRYPKLFFIAHILQLLFGKQHWQGILFTLSFSRQIMQLCYALSALL